LYRKVKNPANYSRENYALTIKQCNFNKYLILKQHNSRIGENINYPSSPYGFVGLKGDK